MKAADQNKIRSRFREYFTAAPLNLAIFRIALFFTLYLTAAVYDPPWFAAIPHELLKPTRWLRDIVPYILMTPDDVRILYSFFLFFCITGMMGFFTRFSAWVCTFLGIYLMGIPQMFGKVNHIHHVIWFAAILGVSRSADVLSVDAVFKAIKRADQGSTDPPKSSVVYGLPIFFVLILFGVVYFFPAFWKLAVSGKEWFLGENLRYQLYRKWVQFPEWSPFFRIDRYPVIYQSVAFFTVFFEIAFLWLVLIPKLRPLLAVAGLMFHNATALFMQISFWWLQFCYVILFDWYKIFRRIGSFLYRSPLYIIYDSHCKLCRRVIASIRVFDLFGSVTYISAFDAVKLKQEGLDWLDAETLAKDMYAVSGKKAWPGFDSYRELAWRVPILWPLLPFFYLWPVPVFGKKIYRRIADARTCSLPKPGGPVDAFNKDNTVGMTGESWFDKGAVIFVGTALIVISSWVGSSNFTSWPFSVYPTFQTLVKNERGALLIEPVNAAGEILTVNDVLFRKRLGIGRWYAMKEYSLKFLENRPRLESYLKGMWKLIYSNDPSVKDAVSVRFYKAVVTGDLDRKKENPLQKELIFEISDFSGSNS